MANRQVSAAATHTQQDTASAPHGFSEVLLSPGDCSGCGACMELAPDIVGWREGDERPFLISDMAPDGVLTELMAFCPEGCFEDGNAP
ncbi:hypothetical protein FVW20_03370 [Desulfovibrio oxamicus]|uniref:4Fe-4S ferredoxin-type domain-containing protein n=1 Tax=Nitratidesulfovibrio oxamicus TaxID=32016 RepID=A0ABS0J0Y1_9BACT|nr:hypothetical protein [Nitratidesulfovibrio oxamicus]MBG3876090.1 hypothetical protein [Nitratidesulfovibrio oxamicus]